MKHIDAGLVSMGARRVEGREFSESNLIGLMPFLRNCTRITLRKHVDPSQIQIFQIPVTIWSW
jgi:hypothetical protein